MATSSEAPSRPRSRLAVALPWLAGAGMIVALLPTLPLALVVPELVLANIPVFLLLILFGVSASRQAREGESTPVLVGAVLGGAGGRPRPDALGADGLAAHARATDPDGLSIDAPGALAPRLRRRPCRGG